MTNEGEVYFALYGDDFDPSEVTRLVGIQPTATRRKGSPVPRHTKWQVSMGKVEGEVIDVYDLSSALVAKLQPHASEIADVKRRFALNAVLQVVLRITTDESISTPAIGFAPEVVAFLSSIGASIDVDTYRNVP